MGFRYTRGRYQRKDKVFAGRRRVLPYLFSLIGGIIALNLLGTLHYDVSAFEVSLDAKVATPGFTRLVIPPIGEITATTHHTPMQFSVTLRNINLDVMRRLVLLGDQGLGERLVADIRFQAERVLWAFAAKMVGLAGLGSLLGVYLLGRRSPSVILVGFLIATLSVGGLLGLTYSTYDIEAFANPEYRGIVEAAPWMIDLFQESILRVEELGEQIQTLATNLYGAFEQIENLRPIGLVDADLVVLHVSDIHNNPVAYDFARQIVASFSVDFVIDTGDLTDWGTPLEAEIVGRIEELSVPYVFTSGNHDAPDVLQRLAQTEGVYLIDNGYANVMGLRMAGVGDAAASSYSPQPAAIEELADTARRINEHYAAVAVEQRPDIFGVHNHRLASAIQPDLFPVVLFGHSHQLSVRQVGGTVYVNAGTTGAAGIRGLQAKDSIPFSLALLYFEQIENGAYQLLAVDGIRVQGLRASFSLDRTFVERSRNQPDSVERMD